jgi:hypothetical protein
MAGTSKLLHTLAPFADSRLFTSKDYSIANKLKKDGEYNGLHISSRLYTFVKRGRLKLIKKEHRWIMGERSSINIYQVTPKLIEELKERKLI